VLHVHSTLLGDLEVGSEHVFSFPAGLLGFPQCREFALLRGARDGLFWLQSLDYPTLAFVLVDPFSVEENYSFDVSPRQLVELGGADPADVGLLAIVTLPSTSNGQPTVNLQGPLIINFRTRRAKQIVSPEGDYSVRRPVDLARLVA
jgi:flagellar assembly factor FliW